MDCFVFGFVYWEGVQKRALQIIPALVWTALNFDGVLTIEFFRYCQTVNDGSLSVELVLTPDHGMIKASKGPPVQR